MSGVELGKIFIIIGVVVIVIGFFIMTNVKIPLFGKLPGDIHVQKENFSFYFPITSCVVISIILSLLFMFFSRK